MAMGGYQDAGLRHEQNECGSGDPQQTGEVTQDPLQNGPTILKN